MSFAHVLKTAIALKEHKDEVAKKKATKEKEWDENVLNKGGVTWWSLTDIVDGVGCNKPKKKTKKVKVCALLQHEEFNTISNKGKFCFRNALGNKIYISVRTYIDADKVVRQMMQVKDGAKTPYNISTEIV